jgi:hypothetical protein
MTDRWKIPAFDVRMSQTRSSIMRSGGSFRTGSGDTLISPSITGKADWSLAGDGRGKKGELFYVEVTRDRLPQPT